MRKGIHPDYQEVVFMDSATGAKFVAGSTLKPEETIEFEGKTYPLVRVEISSDSHPFYTGKHKQMVVSKNSTRSTVCLQRTNNSWFLPKEQPTLDCSFFMLNVV